MSQRKGTLPGRVPLLDARKERLRLQVVLLDFDAAVIEGSADGVR
jgi:hypothetical protein